jgi:hypothetical protein
MIDEEKLRKLDSLVSYARSVGDAIHPNHVAELLDEVRRLQSENNTLHMRLTQRSLEAGDLYDALKADADWEARQW